MPNLKTAITTNRTGRKPLPVGQAKESIYVGLTSAEIEALDRRCEHESKVSGITVTRSELMRKAWLEYEARKKGGK